MARLTPPVGVTGLFILRGPFVAVPTVAYHTGADRTFEEMISRGLDPVKMVYEPVGLGETEYKADLAEGAHVITLLSESQKPLYVPDTYIDSYPNMGVVPHSWVVMTISMGMLPDNYNLTRAIQAVQNAVAADTGVMAEVKVATAPTTDAVTQEQYVQLTQARNAAITNTDTDYTEKLRLQEQNDRLTQQNQDLMVMIEELQNVT